MSVSIKGDVTVRKRLLELARKFPQQAGRALYQEGEAIMSRSKEQYVPVDVGTLKSSGRTHEPEHRGKEVSVKLSYGGAASDYALAQHERMDFQHTVGGPKYLERPLKEAVAGMPGRIAARLKHEGVT